MLFGKAQFAARKDRRVRHVQFDRHVDRLLQALEQVFQRVALGEIARVAVEDEPGLRIGLAEALLEHAQHDVVRNELACVHHRLGLYPERRAGFDRRAQQIARGNVRHAERGFQALGLRALARSVRAEENNAHNGMIYCDFEGAERP
jgi:hypothetical protein